MSLRSHLNIRVRPGQRDAALTAFRARHVLEECAETIPGFVRAEILLSRDDPEQLCIVTYWKNQAASDQWRGSPVREAQSRDLAEFVVEMPATQLFETAE